MAKESLKQEIELFKIPEKEFDKALQYNEFQRKKNLADSILELLIFSTIQEITKREYNIIKKILKFMRV